MQNCHKTEQSNARIRVWIRDNNSSKRMSIFFFAFSVSLSHSFCFSLLCRLLMLVFARNCNHENEEIYLWVYMGRAVCTLEILWMRCKWMWKDKDGGEGVKDKGGSKDKESVWKYKRNSEEKWSCEYEIGICAFSIRLSWSFSSDYKNWLRRFFSFPST